MGQPDGFDSTYPAIARNAAWQKKKSFLDKAKSKTKTGLGDKLTAAEAAYAQIEFGWLDAKMAGPPPIRKWRSEEQIVEGKRRAQAHLENEVRRAIAALEAAASKARTTSKNTALSQRAAAAATAISGALLKQAAGLKSYQLDDFDAEAANLRKGILFARGNFGKKVLELDRKLNELARKPTLAEWTRLDVKNGFRSLGNTLGNDGLYADLWPTWRPWDGFQAERDPRLKGKPTIKTQNEVITEIIHEVQPELVKLKRRAGV